MAAWNVKAALELLIVTGPKLSKPWKQHCAQNRGELLNRLRDLHYAQIGGVISFSV